MKSGCCPAGTAGDGRRKSKTHPAPIRPPGRGNSLRSSGAASERLSLGTATRGSTGPFGGCKLVDRRTIRGCERFGQPECTSPKTPWTIFGIPWTWDRVSKCPKAFRQWLAANEAALRADGVSRRFGNHRRYESLSATSANGTAAAVQSYVDWVGPARSHWALIQKAHTEVGQDPFATFDYLYQSMSAVRRFGRLAKFDYLTMLGKLGLAPIEPPSAYLNGATGPLGGAQKN